ncbi:MULTISPECIES: DUF1254 domain-containing protein [unclassified Novosphingobium]|uniref:DUF1254 domain-containing protein n=1 Tax=unclassified Novosphingobium TaxID=2644732 RepID=UPI0013578D09|nr:MULTISPECIES: DUF1254 domain-containing protein [unclassified Novosphingobium]
MRATRLLAGGLLLALCQATSLGAQSLQAAHSYDPDLADQFSWPVHADLLPPVGDGRRLHAQMLAYDARLYGTSAVLEYAQMYAQAVDRSAPGYTGFNKFAHDRDLARPGYAPFKTPNADTLYSNAWLDLTKGPMILTVPDTHGTYFTANFLDIFANSSNISARTRGFGPGRYAIVPASWKGTLPAGTQRFTVATPYCWILLRVLAKDLRQPTEARAIQSGFSLQAPPGTSDDREKFPAPGTTTSSSFYRVLDWILRNAGHPDTETALVYRYQALGIGLGPAAIETALNDPDLQAGMLAGFKLAGSTIEDSAALSGYPAGTWKTPADTGAYGYNYVYRAAINTLGTGANVVEENYPFNTFVDADGDPLDGSKHAYRMTFRTPPPAKFFWSVTLYDAATRELSPNPIARYIVNDRTPGIRKAKDGSLTISVQHDQPQAANNWLPSPAGRFYLVIRAQGPEEALLKGQWLPPAVRKEPGL